MADEPKPQSWWTTLPGILTASATFVAAVTGLLATLGQMSLFGDEASQAPSRPASGGAVPAAAATNLSTPFPSEAIPTATVAIPFFMKRSVTKADLAGRSAPELELMRNEIYARHGRRFKRPDLQAYFDAQPWYQPLYAPDEFPDTLMTVIQHDNVTLINAAQHRASK